MVLRDVTLYSDVLGYQCLVDVATSIFIQKMEAAMLVSCHYTVSQPRRLRLKSSS